MFNGGMEPNAASLYRKRFGLDVKFVLLEDPSAKLAAFRNGNVDIMWNTVDKWAREASILEEQGRDQRHVCLLRYVTAWGHDACLKAVHAHVMAPRTATTTTRDRGGVGLSDRLFRDDTGDRA